jgi:6,7-dimethyl-8-ribityllumazine synthase
LVGLAFCFSLLAQIDQGPGGPILVLAGSANPFGRYYAEILRTEGFNAFRVLDLSQVSGAVLDGYDLVILGEGALTASQAQMISDYVTRGGNLIAMRPDRQLASLLGVVDNTTTLTNAYLLIHPTGPGAGVVNQTIQYHGPANLYSASGATVVATLYSTATTPTSSPAVTLRTAGSGQAAAFAYDLARSVVLTRQGNPAWVGQGRSGGGAGRSWDAFYGPASFDPQPNWVDRDKLHIPQADEQQRLLANLILTMINRKKPLPRFWYLPNNKKAAVVMTADDHANGGTRYRFDLFNSMSSPGCSVSNWECVRGTAYTFTGGPLSDAVLAAYQAQGHEVSIHLNVNCALYTQPMMRNFLATQIPAFRQVYPSLAAPATNRTHCATWGDWITQAREDVNFGIRLDTTYEAGPWNWYASNPGYYASSAMVMRFADLDGSMVDIYHAPTAYVDFGGFALPAWMNTVLGRAVGTEGYYGFVTSHVHGDWEWQNSLARDIVTSAQARGVPVISARQALTWLDARGASSFGSISWDGSALSFTIAASSAAVGLRAMVPRNSSAGPLRDIQRSGSTVAYTTEVIKGIDYAFFPAASGSYRVAYGSGTPPIAVTSTVPSPGATAVSTGTAVSATFNRAMSGASFTSATFRLRAAGASSDVPAVISVSGPTATMQPSSALASGTSYTATISGSVTDLGGIPMGSTYSWSFTTASAATPPVVVSTVPASGAAGVSTSTAVSAAFNRAMGPASFTATTFRLRAAGASSDVPAAINVSGATATLQPGSALASGTSYTATISGSVTDTSGTPMGSTYSWSFTTATGPTPPVVISTVPAPGATGVSMSTAVSATFNRAMNGASFTSAAFRLRAAGASSDVPATIGVSGATATLQPGSLLAANTTYTAAIAGTVTDTAGTSMGSAYSWTFTTAGGSPGGGLVGHWKFDDGSGTIAADSSGNGNRGIVYGATWTAGHLGGALRFDGVGNFVDIGSPPALNGLTSFTWAAWVYVSGQHGRSTGPAIERGAGSDVARTLTFGSTGGSAMLQVRASVKAGTSASTVSVTNTYAVGVWMHFAITYDDAGERRIRIYKNGSEVSYAQQIPAAGALAADAPYTMAIGATAGLPYYAFNGMIDDVRIYNRVLSASEILALASQ